MKIRFSMEIQIPSQEPVEPRRCRVALLPDCHVQPGRVDEVPSRPTRRLYGCARQLLETYLQRLAPEVDAIFLLGDTLDPANAETLEWLRRQIAATATPVYVLIGNHETHGSVSAEAFHLALGLPADGHQMVRVNDVPFLMLATPSQESLGPGSAGYEWLMTSLEEFSGEDLFCCAHFSLFLHPCVQGSRNDGMQELWSGREVLSLMRRYPNVRAWIAGHKNVPSRVIRDGVLHLLSPQLIQAPCGYRILDIHKDGILSRTYEIEDSHLARLSRHAYGAGYAERHGKEEDRDFWWPFGP